MNRSNNLQLQESTSLETRHSSYDPDVIPDRESPSILSEEYHSYYQNVTPPNKLDESCKDENELPKLEHNITPLMFRPLIKAVPRSDTWKGRKFAKTMIATDTPEKEKKAEECTAALNRKGLHNRKVLQNCSNDIYPSTSKVKKQQIREIIKKSDTRLR
ncbi:unnamed protein product [Arctia plantaginis]|uniref:Uncharacterized protein n=1 Tax=Arctia plantaginis TaxID=874455 RepID=A0A8S0YUU4_ARCPL|nr:unnamed protein product [Arctia plantaginis]